MSDDQKDFSHDEHALCVDLIEKALANFANLYGRKSLLDQTASGETIRMSEWFGDDDEHVVKIVIKCKREKRSLTNVIISCKIVLNTDMVAER